MPIRLLLIDDHAIFRQLAANVLSQAPEFQVVGEAGSVEEALDELARVTPDIVLLDYDLNGRNGMHFLPEARQLGYLGRVLLLSAAVPDFDLKRALSQGIAGLVSKQEPLDRLRAAIRAVAEGRVWLDPKRLGVLTEDEALLDALSARDREILAGLVDGLSNKEIGARLNVPETTVKSGVQILFKKTGVRTRASLVRVALESQRHVG